ncbi:MAG: terminase family protein [Alphaproteobacteria bacterium]|nr:terminase family protein [Alphaproteobacteria bacterium]
MAAAYHKEADAPLRALYPYQQAWVHDNAKFKAGMFSRQSGKTMCTSLEVVKSVIEAEARGKKEDWLILSSGDRQAKEAMDVHIKPNLKAFETLYNDVDNTTDDHGSITYNAYEVVMPLGSRITAVPANPDTARGYSRNLVLDEFAFHRDSHKIWQAVFPIVSRPELKLRVISTPNGKGNKFYEIMAGEDNAWSRHVVDIYTAVEQGLPRDTTELYNAIGDDTTWQQEYELKWLDGNRAWITHDMISAAEVATLPNQTNAEARSACYIGVDVARRNDLSVIVVMEKRGDTLYLIDLIARQNLPFAELISLLDQVTDRYRPLRVAIDQTGMGEMFVETAERTIGGKTMVEGVLFTADRRLALATSLRRTFEDGTIRIPIDRKLRNDLHSMRAEQTATGMTRLVFDGDRSAGHADRFWATALAIAASQDAAIAYGGYAGRAWMDDAGEPPIRYMKGVH